MRRRTGGVVVKQPSAFPPDPGSFLPSHLLLPPNSASLVPTAQSRATIPPSLSNRLSLVNCNVSPCCPHSRLDRVCRWGSPLGQGASLGLAREPQCRSRYVARAEGLQMSCGASEAGPEPDRISSVPVLMFLSSGSSRIRQIRTQSLHPAAETASLVQQHTLGQRRPRDSSRSSSEGNKQNK